MFLLMSISTFHSAVSTLLNTHKDYNKFRLAFISLGLGGVAFLRACATALYRCNKFYRGAGRNEIQSA